MLIRRRPAKAQVMIFEQVLLFAMGVIIFIVCFAAFNIYQSHFSSISANDQLNEVRDVLVSEILKLYNKGEGVNSSIRVDIPDGITGRAYKVELDNSGLNITLQGPEELTKRSTVFNIGKNVTLLGRVISTTETVMIYKKANEIIIV